jgi:hypothetical protein
MEENPPARPVWESHVAHQQSRIRTPSFRQALRPTGQNTERRWIGLRLWLSHEEPAQVGGRRDESATRRQHEEHARLALSEAAFELNRNAQDSLLGVDED